MVAKNTGTYNTRIFCLTFLHEQEEDCAEIGDYTDGVFAPAGYPLPVVLRAEHIKDDEYADDDIYDGDDDVQRPSLARYQQINAVQCEYNAERKEDPQRYLLRRDRDRHADDYFHDAYNQALARILIPEIVHDRDNSQACGDDADYAYEHGREARRSVEKQYERAENREDYTCHFVHRQIDGEVCRHSFVTLLSFAFLVGRRRAFLIACHFICSFIII